MPNPREEFVSTELLDCTLTDEEILRYGKELADTIQSVEEEQARQEGVKQEMKGRLLILQGKVTELSGKVNRGREMRPVKVQTVRDYGKSLFEKIRTDTGEVLVSRTLREDERQASLLGT